MDRRDNLRKYHKKDRVCQKYSNHKGSTTRSNFRLATRAQLTHLTSKLNANDHLNREDVHYVTPHYNSKTSMWWDCEFLKTKVWTYNYEY
jgi:hypothetical protein